MGTQAFGAQIEQDLGLFEEQSGKLHFGAELFNAFTPTLSTFPLVARDKRYRTRGSGEDGYAFTSPRDIDSLYYIGLSTHGYVSYRLPESVLKGAYVQAGGGMHRINAVTVGVANGGVERQEELNQAKQYSYFDPFIKLGYIRSGDAGDEYGVSVQYCNTFLAHGFIKLFPWLQLEAKYSAVIGRDVRPWEWKDYVMVSPRLMLNF